MTVKTVTRHVKRSCPPKHVIVLATGARARDLPFAGGRRQDLVWTYQALRCTRARNAEEAARDRVGRDRHRVRQLLQRRWAPMTTVVEMLDRIVPVEDARGQLPSSNKSLHQAGHDDHGKGAGVEDLKVTRQGQGDRARSKTRTANGPHERVRPTVITAIGIIAQHVRTSGSSKKLGVKLEKTHVGFIQIDPYGRTGVERPVGHRRLYAGAPWLAHKASRMRALPPQRPSRRSWATRTVHPHPLNRSESIAGLHLLPPANRQRGL